MIGDRELPKLAPRTNKRLCSNSARGRLEMEREARIPPPPRRAPRSGAANAHTWRSFAAGAESGACAAGRARRGPGPYPRGSSPRPRPSPGRPGQAGTSSSALPAPRWLRRCHELRRHLQAGSPVAGAPAQAPLAARASQLPTSPPAT